MIAKLRQIKLGTWIFIAMISGLIVGLSINFFVSDPFIKDVLLMNNVFYLGGTGFIRLMKMLVVPLVTCSIVVGVASLSDIRKIGSIGGRTILIYLITTTIAVSIALLVGMVVKPGLGLNMSVASQVANVTANQTLTDTILSSIPDNPFHALATGDMLPVIIFALIIGIILAKLKDETKLVNQFFTEGNTIMLEMTAIVMKFAPIGVFCLMAKTFGGLGISGIVPLAKYFGCVLLALAIQAVLVYPTLLVAFTRLNPIKFFKQFIPVMFFAFSSTSSNATIPLTLEKLSEMGVSRNVSSFTIPLGATINMDGTSIMQGVAVMFAAQAYGIDLGFAAILTVIVTAVMASIGAAGIPSVGLVTLTMVFNSVGLPVQAIGIIFGIDYFLDMCRSAVNVTGDAICTIIVSAKNKAFDADVFNGKKEPESTYKKLI